MIDYNFYDKYIEYVYFIDMLFDDLVINFCMFFIFKFFDIVLKEIKLYYMEVKILLEQINIGGDDLFVVLWFNFFYCKMDGFIGIDLFMCIKVNFMMQIVKIVVVNGVNLFGFEEFFMVWLIIDLWGGLLVFFDVS